MMVVIEDIVPQEYCRDNPREKVSAIKLELTVDENHETCNGKQEGLAIIIGGTPQLYQENTKPWSGEPMLAWSREPLQTS